MELSKIGKLRMEVETCRDKINNMRKLIEIKNAQLDDKRAEIVRLSSIIADQMYKL